VWNKSDAVEETIRGVLASRAETHSPPALLVSALTGQGVDELLFAIEGVLFRNRRPRLVTIPASDGRLHAWLHKNCEVSAEMLSGETELTLEVFMTDEDIARLLAMSPDVRIEDGR
jgi:GTP-binding protein HflX